MPSFTVLNYTAITGSVTVSATSEAAPTVVVTASAGIVVDGATLICAEFYSPNVAPAASSTATLNLWDDTAGVALGRVWTSTTGTAASTMGVFTRRYFTPAAGTRTYSIRGWRVTADYTVFAGTGGATSYFPTYLRLTSGS